MAHHKPKTDPVLPDQGGRVMHINEQSNREEVVRLLAYQFYELRGREEGHALEDWLAAEHSLHFEQELPQAA
jgi:Protein of unknown function (DUF2934)